MARQRDLLVNIDRMRREMDELFEDAWSRAPLVGRRPTGFSPRVNVYYEKPRSDSPGAGPVAVVKADLAGIAAEAVSLEISGRELVISGSRPPRETEGRAFQQVEIPTGAFRRVIQLGADIDAERAVATFEDGMLRIELPIRVADTSSRVVPIERVD